MSIKSGLGILAIIGIAVISCNTPSSNENEQQPRLTEAASLLQRTYIAHGGDRYETAHYQFTFRGTEYEFQNNASSYRYQRVKVANDSTTTDIFENGKMSRLINDQPVSLSDKDIAKYSESVNSVIYFATLPHKLNDPAVNLAYKGEVSIKQQQYDILEVTFNKEGGGVDYSDQYHYWINKTDRTIDYLAYNYKTNNGGVRFRSAYNRRKIDGIIFQDYINYKAEIGTPLVDLPALFEKDELKELSKIETEDIEVMK